MNRDDEIRQCEEVVAWARGKPKAVVQARLGELLRTNAYARELYGPASGNYGDDLSDEKPVYLSNHTGYGRPGSENWEHDTTGSAMNYSGVEDDVMNAFIEHEGWQPDEDFKGSERK